MKEVDKYKFLGILEGAKIMNKEMKVKIRGEYLRRVKLLAKSRLYAGNLIRGINAWAVSVVRYSAGILDWNKGELKEMDKKTRHILTMFGVFHEKSSVPRLYVKRKDGGRGLISVMDCVREEELGLSAYVSQSDEWMMKAVAENCKAGETKLEYRQLMLKERKS